jgi:NAD-dependent deacetylase
MKITFLTGAGISQPSGIEVFSGGIWSEYDMNIVASPKSSLYDEVQMKLFWQQVRNKMLLAQPNIAHYCISALEKNNDVCVLTQNVDDLHERAGSTNVHHLHGSILYARHDVDRYFIGNEPIDADVRLDIVLFGESIYDYDFAKQRISESDVFVVIGTSLTVYPVNKLLKCAKKVNTKYILDVDRLHRYMYLLIQGNVCETLPLLVERWL